MTDRASLDVNDLLKIVLVLVILWLILEILGEFLSITLGLFGPLRPIIGILILVLIGLWLLDRI